jgi:hypothetical protein
LNASACLWLNVGKIADCVIPIQRHKRLPGRYAGRRPILHDDGGNLQAIRLRDVSSPVHYAICNSHNSLRSSLLLEHKKRVAFLDKVFIPVHPTVPLPHRQRDVLAVAIYRDN